MADTPPAWLNREFLEKALRSYYKRPQITVTSCEMNRAALPGDHYGSEMYRATLKTKDNGKTEETSVVIKCRLQGGELSKMIEDVDIYVREARTFTDIHIPMYNILKEIFPEDFKEVAAKCIYVSEEPEAIVLEDLKKEGFRLASINNGLDLKHCLLVMRSIALYHASSLILRLQNPNVFEQFMGDVFSDNFRKGMSKMFSSTTRSLKEQVRTWPGYERYQTFLNSLENTAMDHWINAVLRDEAGFNVLIHGDLWVNNMMFRYSEENNEVQEVRFVDFQLSYVSSPAVDLVYFMNSSASPEVLENDRHFLIDEYYRTLCQALAKLGRPDLQPTRDDLNAQLKKKQMLGVVLATSGRSIVQADRNHVPDMDNLIKENSDIHISDSYKETIQKLLPLYEKLGWIKV